MSRSSVLHVMLLAGMVSTACRSKKHDAEQLSAEQLLGLPYLAGATAGKKPDGAGVVKYTTSKVAPHLVAFVPDLFQEQRAVVIDLDGHIRHEWHLADAPTDDINQTMKGWGAISPEANGDLYATVGDDALVKLDRSSKLIWKTPVPGINHDIEVTGDDVRVLDSAVRLVDVHGETVPLLDRGIVTLSTKDGARKSAFSIYDLMDKSPKTHDLLANVVARCRRPREMSGNVLSDAPEETTNEILMRAVEFLTRFVKDPKEVARSTETRDQLIAAAKAKDPRGMNARHMLMLENTQFDIFHANSVEVARAGVAGLWDAGDLLISVRHMDIIMVVDPAGTTIKWAWGPGEISRQHAATFLANSNILLYDNGFSRRKTRFVEVDPRTNKIVWKLDTTFFALGFGAVERLPNQNLVATDPTNSRLLELTPEGEVVWDYHSPYLSPLTKAPSWIYRAHVLPIDYLGLGAGSGSN